MEKSATFPTFECMISNTKEEYDSEVETFFTTLTSLESDIGVLLFRDAGWKENYRKIMSYLADLETTVIFKRSVPDSGFLKDLLPAESPQDEISDVLLRAKSETPAILVRAQAKARDVGTLFAKMSRVPRFAGGFTFERFEGLPDLRSVLWNRAVELSKQ